MSRQIRQVAMVYCLAGLVLGLAFRAAPALGASGAWAQSENSAARLIADGESVGNSGKIRIGLQIRLDDGWHTYWRSPGDAGVPPEFDWRGSQGIAGATVHWPVPKRLVEGDLVSLIYEREVVLPIDIEASAPGRAIALRLKATFGVCADICVPVEAELALDLPDGSGAPSVFRDLIERYALRVPRRDESAGLKVLAVERPGGVLSVKAFSTVPMAAPDLLVEGGGFGAGTPKVTLSRDRRDAVFEMPKPTRPQAGPLTITVIDGQRAVETVKE